MGTDHMVKKFPWPLTAEAGVTTKEKVERECRKTFLVDGGSVTDLAGVDVETFARGVEYLFLNFKVQGEILNLTELSIALSGPTLCVPNIFLSICSPSHSQSNYFYSVVALL